MVWLHGPAGRELAPAGSIFGWVEAEGRGSTTGAVPIDAGRYDFRVPQGTTRVSVSRGRNGFQPCAVTLTPTADVTADLHVVTDARWRGAHLPAELLAQSPTLSGVVYEATPEGRRAVRDAWVWLDGVYGLGQLVADTRTDDEGRYILCAVPALSSLVLQVSANGFQLFESSGNLPGRDTLDVELRRNGASPAR